MSKAMEIVNAYNGRKPGPEFCKKVFNSLHLPNLRAGISPPQVKNLGKKELSKDIIAGLQFLMSTHESDICKLADEAGVDLENPNQLRSFLGALVSMGAKCMWDRGYYALGLISINSENYGRLGSVAFSYLGTEERASVVLAARTELLVAVNEVMPGDGIMKGIDGSALLTGKVTRLSGDKRWLWTDDEFYVLDRINEGDYEIYPALYPRLKEWPVSEAASQLERELVSLQRSQV